MNSLGLAPKLEAALVAAGVETPEALAALGFDAACEIPGVWRAGVKGAFDKLEEVLLPRYRDQARFERVYDDGLKIDDDAEVSFGNDRGAYVAAWVWVSSDDV